MRFEWNEKKNRANRECHGIPFEIAQEVFRDPFCLIIDDRVVGKEQRHWAVGRLESLVVIVVVHVHFIKDGEEVVRIISARKATPRERQFYEET
jgi:hypothetical protein